MFSIFTARNENGFLHIFLIFLIHFILASTSNHQFVNYLAEMTINTTNNKRVDPDDADADAVKEPASKKRVTENNIIINVDDDDDDVDVDESPEVATTATTPLTSYLSFHYSIRLMHHMILLRMQF